MNTETSSIEDLAIEAIKASVKAISKEDAAKTFIQTVISNFQKNYTIENPDNVKKSVRPVTKALQGLQRKGFDMRPYAEQVITIAVLEFEKYSGAKETFAHVSTLTVIDNVTHKPDTGYWKKKNN
jgi:ribosomal protein S20